MRNIDRFKTAVKENYSNISDYQLGKKILMSLGDSEEFVNNLPREKVLEALEYTEAVQTTTFLRETENGFEEISEDEFYSVDNNSAVASKNGISAQSYNGYDETEEQGELILHSTAYKRAADPYRTYFVMRGDIQWKTYPWLAYSSGTDTLVLHCDGHADNHYDRRGGVTYESGIQYAVGVGQGNSIFKVYTPVLSTLAADARFDIGDMGAYSRIKSMYAYNGFSSEANTVSCLIGYGHMTAGFGSLGISINGKGFSFSVSGTQKLKPYMGKSFSLNYGIEYK